MALGDLTTLSELRRACDWPLPCCTVGYSASLRRNRFDLVERVRVMFWGDCPRFLGIRGSNSANTRYNINEFKLISAVL